MRRLLGVILALVACLLLPGAAAAQRCVAPPGTGAIDQYCETIPTSKGDRDAAGPGGGPETKLPPGTANQLNDSGSDGQALAQALGQDPPAAPSDGKPTPSDGKPSKQRASRGSKGVPAVDVPSAPSSNPFSAVTQSIGGGSTIGGTFVAALIGVVLLMAGWGWLAYRRRSAS